MQQITKPSEYMVSFNYGNGGFRANDPVILTDEQARYLAGTSCGNIESALGLLVEFHRINTSQQHPLGRTPVSQIVAEKMERLEVVLQRVD